MITLKTLQEATEQQVFDQVARHLLTQGKKSMDWTGNRCSYVGQDDLKCAAGCLISEDEYLSSIENKYWGWLVNEGFAPRHHSVLIGRLQDIHDDSDVDDWITCLENLAAEKYLNTSVLDEFK